MFVFSDHSEEELWKSSFLAAITLHAAVLLTILLAPFFSSNEFTLPKAYTVNLVAMPTAAPPAPARTTPPAKPQPVIPADPKPLPPDTKAPTAETLTAPPALPVAPLPRAVSLSPMNTKKWLTPKKKAREQARQEEILKKRLLTAQKNEEIANSAEQKAARTAVADLSALIRARELLQNSSAAAPAAANDTGSVNSGNAPTDGVLASTLFEQYQADVYRKIQQHWILPPLQDWEDSLIAVVVMRVREDGSLTDLFFEKKSANTFFNQFVMNTVRQAAPMPPFPEKMSRSSMEFGLRFSPGGLF